MAAYMRHHFTFLGLPAPVRRKAAAGFMATMAGGSEDELLSAAERLWSMGAREYAYVGADLLRAEWRQLGPAAMPRLQALVTTDPWWDTVDPLSHVIGVLVLNHRDLTVEMDRWIASDDRWLVRVALLHQLSWKRAADPERIFRYCLAVAGQTDFFVRKAVGWALRDLSATFPDEVLAFVDAHLDELDPMSVREATKHL